MPGGLLKLMQTVTPSQPTATHIRVMAIAWSTARSFHCTNAPCHKDAVTWRVGQFVLRTMMLDRVVGGVVDRVVDGVVGGLSGLADVPGSGVRGVS